MLDRIRNEPALVSGFLAAALTLGVSFGFKLTPEQVGGIVALFIAGAAFFTRSQVSPVTPVPPAAPDPSVP